MRKTTRTSLLLEPILFGTFPFVVVLSSSKVQFDEVGAASARRQS